MKISVITPSLNQAHFIERTLQSVINQAYSALEYLVIDGGSTDGTLEILKRYETHLSWISEHDTGQAQAINKGLRQARGDIVCWLNADDELTPGALHAVSAYFRHHPEAMLVYGHATAIDDQGRNFGYRSNVKPTNFQELVTQGDFIVQPAAFWRAEVLAEIGYLDESLFYCLDYEYWLRITQQYAPHYLPVLLAKERFHPQAKTLKAGVQRMKEVEAITRQYGGSGMPSRFRAEQTAVYLAQILAQLGQAQWGQAKTLWRNQSPHFYLSPLVIPHMLAALLGPMVTTYFRLYANWLRSKRHKRQVVEFSIWE